MIIFNLLKLKKNTEHYQRTKNCKIQGFCYVIIVLTFRSSLEPQEFHELFKIFKSYFLRINANNIWFLCMCIRYKIYILYICICIKHTNIRCTYIIFTAFSIFNFFLYFDILCHFSSISYVHKLVYLYYLNSIIGKRVVESESRVVEY